HSQYGIFVLYNDGLMDSPVACELVSHAKRGSAHILDVAPTVLGCMGLEAPLDMKGNAINRR
ncbi:MAG: hypothetical protein AAB048_06105, partial [Planctomycetota bacterium]